MEETKKETIEAALANCEKLKELYKQQEEVLDNITKYANQQRAEIKKKKECLRQNESHLKLLNNKITNRITTGE